MEAAAKNIHRSDHRSDVAGAMRDEPSLVGRARRGDGDAFRCLVERHGPDLLRLAHRLTGERASAEDVVQEALLKAHRSLDGFDGRSRVGTWLHRITTNCALDLLRRQQRHPGDTAPGTAPGTAPEDADPLARLASDEPGPLRHAVAAEARRQVVASLSRLTPLERTAFVLRHFEERSIAEIGEALGRSENTAKQTVFRAVHKLRRELAPLAQNRPEALPEGERP